MALNQVAAKIFPPKVWPSAAHCRTPAPGKGVTICIHLTQPEHGTQTHVLAMFKSKMVFWI